MVADPLAAASLMPHVRALAEEIGPRPAGHAEELRARQYIRGALTELGYDEIETLPFPAPDTWGYALGNPLALGLATNLWPARRRFLGGLVTLACTYTLWDSMRINKQPLATLAPRRPSANLIVRILPAAQPRRRLVLLGHTDSNKHRPTFHPKVKKALPALTTFALGALLGNGLAQVAEGWGSGKGARRFRLASAAALGLGLGIALFDEQGGYVPGANDNASAVACLLGLAAQLRARPLRHTEVWLVFTGAEEVGCLGTHALLDTYGDLLREAWFLDFEMVGSTEIAYVTRHSGFALVTAYRPDAASLAWAEATARRCPELGITGRALVIGEEVGALRSRGFRGLCLAGYGPDGWLENWHQNSDDVAHLNPAGLEKAARFAWEMLLELDHAHD